VNGLDVSIIILSLAIVLVVGLWTARKGTDSASGYFLASRRLPWFLIGTSFVSTSVSSEQIVGTVGAAYRHGMKIANWELWSLPAYSLLIFVFIPIYLKNRISTVPEFLSRRYGPRCADLYSWIMLFAYVFIFMVAVLYGGSLTFSEVTGLNRPAVLWITVVLVGAYTIKGGLASVVWTDAAQCVMLLGGGMILFLLALSELPGGLFEAWESMRAAHPERFHLYNPPSDPIAPFPGLIVSTFGLALFYQATNQVMIQRVLAARSTWDGVLGIIFAGFINFFRPLATCFLGFVVFHWIHVLKHEMDLSGPDHAFPVALKVFSPEWGLRGIVLAGFLAAVMSTISSLVNSIATIFAFDVYGKLIRPDAPDRRLVQVGQIASAVALVVAAFASPVVGYLGGIFLYFQQAVTYLATPFASVALMGVLWKRTNYAGGLFGIIGGLVIQLATVAIAHAAGLTLNWLYLAFIAQVLTLAGIVVVSLLTAPPAESQWRPFLWRPGLVKGFSQDLPRPWHQSIAFWFGLFAIVWVLIYWYLW
jgi:SSS family solute:Na+ symporter